MGESIKGRTPLIHIDDEKTVLDTVRHVLREKGFAVQSTQDPEQAVPMLFRHQPAAALVDLNMPGTNGLVLLDRIKKASGIPVIMVTGEDSVELAVRATKLGAYAYLTKPLDFKKLVETIQAAIETSSPGKRQKYIAHYELLGELGRGGMGVVYQARDTMLDRPVALKVLLPDMVSDPRSEARLLNEARALARLDHPAIVRVHEVNRESGYLYIAMELVEGTSLESLLRSEHKFTPEEVMRLGMRCAEGLALAHARQVIHRDIKPANVILAEDGSPKLVDFGLARSADKPSPLDEGFSGTLGFAPPEQIANQVPTPRSDIFSLGSVLCRLLRTEEFHSVSNAAPLVRMRGKVVEDPFDQVRTRNDIPQKFLELLRSMTHRDLEKRTVSMEEVAWTIGGCLGL